MITSRIDRHAKPFVRPIVTALKVSSVRFTDTFFSTSITRPPTNLGSFDVIDVNGRVLDRMGNVEGPEYVQSEGQVIVTVPGEYLLRVYDNVHDMDSVTVKIENFEYSDGSRGVMGVRFWPEILSQPEGGAARLSNDGDGISIIVATPGQYAFGYRLRNYLGQVSESSCVYVTAVA